MIDIIHDNLFGCKLTKWKHLIRVRNNSEQQVDESVIVIFVSATFYRNVYFALKTHIYL